MNTYDFATDVAMFEVQRFANRNGWRIIKAKYVGANTDNPHWRLYYI